VLAIRRLRTSRPRLAAALAAALATSLLNPSAARAEEPGSPAAAETIIGELVQAWPEYEHRTEATHRGDEGPLSWIETPEGDLVRVPTEEIEDVPDAVAGATLAVTVGDDVADSASEDDGLDPARQVLEAEVLAPAAPAPPDAPPPAPAEPVITNAVTVVMVRPGGIEPDSRTVQQVVDMVDGSVASFWREQSDGAVEIGVTASHSWISTTATCASPGDLWTQAAAAVGWSQQPGRHLLLYLPGNAPGCAYGLAEMGGGGVQAARLYVTDVALSLLAHEFGHNLGLGHSSGIRCDGAVDSGRCALMPYDDLYDVMGFSWEQVGTLNAPQAALLGFLPAEERISVPAWSAAAEHTLVPVSSTTGTRVLDLIDPSGGHYWVEYRTASGQDSWLGTSGSRGLQEGVILRRAPSHSAYQDTSLLLDGTPSPISEWPSDRAVALPVGHTVKVTGAEVALTVLSVSGTEAAVRVEPGVTPIGVKYVATGGPSGPLGTSSGRQVCGLRDGGCSRAFVGGSIYWTPATGAQVVTGAIATRWASLAAQKGRLGYPVTDTVCGLADGGCFQHFQHGSMYWSPATGAHFVSRSIQKLWGETGSENGALGYPTGDEHCGLRGGGCFQTYQGGSIYWSAATGAHLVWTPLRDKWAAMGYESGTLGYPLTNTLCGGPSNGCLQAFQGGVLYWTAATGAWLPTGPIKDLWVTVGAEWGVLGYPTGDVHCGLRGGGCFQTYQGGSIYWSAATGAHPVRSPIREKWGELGYENGAWGYPTSNPIAVDGGATQRFQNGTARYDIQTGAVTFG
jgi:uncharacterized protein with LGFP repeats